MKKWLLEAAIKSLLWIAWKVLTSKAGQKHLGKVD